MKVLNRNQQLAVGCPMILSARGEAVQLLRASGCGIHVEPNDARALAGGIERCLAERDVLERGALAGQAFVRENFDSQRSIHRYRELLLN